MLMVINALTHAGFEELATDALIHADGSGHLFDISASGFTQGRDGVYTTNALSQECICCLKTQAFFYTSQKNRYYISNY